MKYGRNRIPSFGYTGVLSRIVGKEYRKYRWKNEKYRNIGRKKDNYRYIGNFVIP